MEFKEYKEKVMEYFESNPQLDAPKNSELLKMWISAIVIEDMKFREERKHKRL